jgi:cytosine/uracil/thiamine/allantoin permease
MCTFKVYKIKTVLSIEQPVVFFLGFYFIVWDIKKSCFKNASIDMFAGNVNFLKSSWLVFDKLNSYWLKGFTYKAVSAVTKEFKKASSTHIEGFQKLLLATFHKFFHKVPAAFGHPFVWSPQLSEIL